MRHRLARPFRALGEALSDANAGVLPVFTTNYDETFEVVESDLAGETAPAPFRKLLVFKPTRDLRGYRGVREIAPELYRTLTPRDGALTVVPVHLHGSVRWAYTEERAGRYTLLQLDERTARREDHYRVLLPPDGTKAMYAHTHERFSDALGSMSIDPFRPGEIYYAMRVGYMLLKRSLRQTGSSLRLDTHFGILTVWRWCKAFASDGTHLH